MSKDEQIRKLKKRIEELENELEFQRQSTAILLEDECNYSENALLNFFDLLNMEKRYSILNSTGRQQFAMVRDTSGEIRYVTSGVSKVLGYSSLEFRERFFTFFTSNFSNESARASMEQSLIGRSVVNYQLELKNRLGNKVILAVQDVPVHDEEDQVIAIESIFNNITPHKIIEKALRNERDSFQKYLDIAAVIFITTDGTGTITFVNVFASQVLGYREDELLGQNFIENYVAPDFKDSARQHLKDLIENSNSATNKFECEIITKKHGIRRVHWHNSNIQDDDQHSIGVISSCLDITETYQLKRDRRRFRFAMDNSLTNVFIINPENQQILDANQYACTSFGYSLEEFKTLAFSDITPYYSKKMLTSIMRETIDGKEESEAMETVQNSKQGESIPVQITLNPFSHDDEGTLIIAICSNVEEQVKHEIDLSKNVCYSVLS